MLHCFAYVIANFNLRQLLFVVDFFQLTIFQASGANSFGVVVGGSSIEQRRLCATEVSKRNVSGFYLFIYFNIFNSLGKEWRLS